MIVIDNIELSKNPVSTSEVFIIRVTAREEMAIWDDLQVKTWGNLTDKTWDMVRRKII